jgi:hypothetical protein
VIRVVLAPKPPHFDATVRTPGLRAVHEMCGMPLPPELKRTGGRAYNQRTKKHPADPTQRVLITDPADLPGDELPDKWCAIIPDLMRAYSYICAYCCERIRAAASPSVDHLIPKSRAWDKAYEWDNYRLAALKLNAFKGDDPEVIDPFEVQPGWFALELDFGQIKPGPVAEADPALKARVKKTITRLKLDSEAMDEDRMGDARDYWSRELGWARVQRDMPFLAAELRRQGRLNDGDT